MPYRHLPWRPFLFPTSSHWDPLVVAHVSEISLAQSLDVRVSLKNRGVVVESALLAVQNDVDAIGATRGVRADMVETNLKSVTQFFCSRTNDIRDGRLMNTL